MYILPRVASPESSPECAFEVEFSHRSIYVLWLLANVKPCVLPNFGYCWHWYLVRSSDGCLLSCWPKYWQKKIFNERWKFIWIWEKWKGTLKAACTMISLVAKGPRKFSLDSIFFVSPGISSRLRQRAHTKMSLRVSQSAQFHLKYTSVVNISKLPVQRVGGRMKSYFRLNTNEEIFTGMIWFEVIHGTIYLNCQWYRLWN
jgi:hypothetical protein